MPCAVRGYGPSRSPKRQRCTSTSTIIEMVALLELGKPTRRSIGQVTDLMVSGKTACAHVVAVVFVTIWFIDDTLLSDGDSWRV